MKNYFSSFKKRGISLLIAMTMCMSMMPVNAFAADGEGAEPETAAASAEAAPVETTSEASADDDVKIIVSDEPQALDLDSSDVQTIDIDLTDGQDGGETSKDDADESDNLSEESGDPAVLNEEDITSDTSDEEDGTADPSDEENGEPVALDEEDGDAVALDEEDGETVEAEPEALAETGDYVWNGMEDTRRPEASEGVVADTGTKDDKAAAGGLTEAAKKDWTIFYDAENDVYNITFNIGSKAEGIQTLDLTEALRLLNQYADNAEAELKAAKDQVQVPVKQEITEPVKEDVGEAPEPPKAPAEFDEAKPIVPDEPVEPGKPEGLDETIDNAYNTLFERFSGADNASNTKENVLAAMGELGLDTNDKYVQDYADYFVKKADNAFLIHVFETRGAGGNEAMFRYFMCWESSYSGQGDPTDEQVAQAIASVQRQDDRLKVPEYEIDKESEAYKAYETAMSEYQGKLDEYQAQLDEYNKKLDAYLAEHGPESAEYKEYQANLEAYNNQLKAYEDAKAAAEAKYQAALAKYAEDKAAIEKQYADDVAAYEKAIADLEKAYKSKVEADVLQPGDVRKFNLYLTSDSKHTYKYKSGSFVLATPEWNNPDGTVTGFDTQILPDKYVDNHNYYVTVRAEPIQAMFRELGMDDPDLKYVDGNGNIDSYPSYWDNDIKSFLSKYGKETVAENLNAYLLDYYNSKDNTQYTTIDELIQNNPKAQEQLTQTITSGNKWFDIDNERFVVDAHTETVLYDTFYKQLFSFAFGVDPNDPNKDKKPHTDMTSISEILGNLGKPTLNTDTGFFEYENDSWTNNGYLNALYYYMDHQEIWEQTDAYFKALLDGGLNNEQATWTSLMMALNIDGELTGNDWQDTEWPWYSSIQLERMDIDFNLTKKDGETGEAIKDKTGFEIYYIDKVKNEDGTETSVNMYCTPTVDEDGNVSYTFTPTKSTVWTDENGNLKIDYAMMKDIVYYLKEVVAPEGYTLDPNVYIVMNEEDYNNLSDEQKAELEGTFDAFLDMVKSEDGLTVNADFVNVKIVTHPTVPDTPDTPNTPSTPNTPDTPDTPDEPDDDDEPTTEVPDEPTPLMDVPDEDVPLAEIVEEDVPLTDIAEEDVPLTDISDEDVPLTDLFDEEVPLADVPMTGDSGIMMLCLALALCLGGVLLLKKREEA